MAETVALSKFACPACGGEAIWNPAKQKLVCPFCGTESPAKLDAGGAIVEHDLVAALRGIGDDARGWQAEKRQVKCQSCNAISVLDPSRQAQSCEFCGSAQLVPYEETKPRSAPRACCRSSCPKARRATRSARGTASCGSRLRRSRRRAMTDTVRGVYLPYWTFDARVDAEWTAEAGHYYYTTETYREGGQTRTRQVQHVRWEPAAGRAAAFLRRRSRLRVRRRAPGAPARDRAVPDRRSSGRTTPGYVAGWVVERYQIDLVAAAQRSRDAMDAKVQALCAQQVPGDTFRNLRVRTDYSGQTFKHILAPVWLLTYTYGARGLPVCDERRDRRRARRVPEEPLEDRAPRARDLHRRA